MKAFFTNFSKKLSAFLITIGVVILNRKLDIGLEENDIYAITGGLGAYVLGQGLSDMGKSKAIVEIRERQQSTKVA